MKTFPTSAAWCFGILFISVSLIKTGSSEVVGPADRVVALAGDDVILPCSLKPSVNAEEMTVKWTGLNLRTTEDVHLYLDGRDFNVDQSPSYRGRTSMFHEELKNGNVSLKLTRVTVSDTGSYTCFIPTLTSQVKETTVQLLVGAVSQPVISIDGTKGWGVVLKCESGGWFPKPVMEWLDSSGTILPADGPPERHRDSEDLYAVRQHVTVDQTDTNRFTCRVQQPEINHLKETEIHVPDLTFPKSQLILGLSIAAAAVVVLAASAGFYKWRKHTEVYWWWRRKHDEKKIRKQMEDWNGMDGDVRFVNINKDDLIQNVAMVIPIAFYLIHSEMYSEIHDARTRQDQMALLYEALDSREGRLKSDFYRILKDLEPELVKHLGALFVDSCKDQLIQRVTQVEPILYELFYEKYCNIRIYQMTSQDQMKRLYQALEKAEDTERVKSDFYKILLHLEPGLVIDLDEARRQRDEARRQRDEARRQRAMFRRQMDEARRQRDDDDLSEQLEKVTSERDVLQRDLNELNKNLTGKLEELRIENDGLKEELREAKETIQSLSTSPGGQQETQTPSQKSERIEGMEMKSLPGRKSAPGSGRKSAPEEESLLAAGPQKDDLDEMERGGRVATDFNSML